VDSASRRIRSATSRFPTSAYYGVQTARGIHNFPISGHAAAPRPGACHRQVKKAAARANMATGRLPKQLGNAIVEAADEILRSRLGVATTSSDDFGRRTATDPMKAAFEAARAAKQAELIDNFRIDPFQAGAGTSHNMNANEVLANRAIELLHASGVGSGKRGDYAVVSPNDHVNMAQSTNDVFPTSMRIATLDLIRDFMPAAEELIDAFEQKAVEFDDVIKSGRTHMQDAVPIRLGQEFAAYALTLRRGVEQLQAAAHSIAEQNIGATAVGTGLNAEPEYIELVVRNLAEQTGHPLRGAQHLVQATQSMRPMLEVSAALARHRRGPDQDQRGSAADVVGPDDRLRRDHAAGGPAGQFDHAGQGEPGHGRVPVDGLLPGDRQRHHDRLGRLRRPARAERDDAGHRPHGPREPDDPDEHEPAPSPSSA
jgi:aspartate ammonia-lyase